MKERGMIFNGEMVRAILDDRKTQTRRIINPQPSLTRSGFFWKGSYYGAGSSDAETNRNFAHVACPHGKPGDRLWVRETFATGLSTKSTLAYRATHKRQDLEDGFYDTIKWTPSIHMPRWASRITLEITSVWVERLNDISKEDAVAEGIKTGCCGNETNWRDAFYVPGDKQPYLNAATAYGYLWKSIYGDESWQANPWVWAVEFRRVEGVAV